MSTEAIKQLQSTFNEYVETQNKRSEASNKTESEFKEHIENITNSYNEQKTQIDELYASNQRNTDVETVNVPTKSFVNFLKTGVISNEMRVDNDESAGVLVESVVSSRIIEAADTGAPILDHITTDTVANGGSMKFTIDADELAVTNSGEGSSASDTELNFIEREIFFHKMDTEPSASYELISQSGWDIVAYLQAKAGRAFGRAQNSWYTVGTGVKQAKGLMAYTGVANATFEADVYAAFKANQVGFVASGTAATIGNGDGLVALIDALDSQYDANAVIMLNKATLTAIKQLKRTTTTADDNSYLLWTPSFQPGVEDKLNGYNIVKNSAMPSIGANAYPIAFGDLKQAYTAISIPEMRIIVDRYTNKSRVKFYFAQQRGGGIVNNEAVKYFKCAE